MTRTTDPAVQYYADLEKYLAAARGYVSIGCAPRADWRRAIRELEPVPADKARQWAAQGVTRYDWRRSAEAAAASMCRRWTATGRRGSIYLYQHPTRRDWWIYEGIAPRDFDAVRVTWRLPSGRRTDHPGAVEVRPYEVTLADKATGQLESRVTRATSALNAVRRALEAERDGMPTRHYFNFYDVVEVAGDWADPIEHSKYSRSAELWAAEGSAADSWEDFAPEDAEADFDPTDPAADPMDQLSAPSADPMPAEVAEAETVETVEEKKNRLIAEIQCHSAAPFLFNSDGTLNAEGRQLEAAKKELAALK